MDINMLLILHVGTSLNSRTADDIKRSLLKKVYEHSSTSVLLDCSRTKDIDSVGLGVLLSLSNHFKEKGISFSLSHVSNAMMGIMKIMRLDRQIAIEPADEVKETQAV